MFFAKYLLPHAGSSSVEIDPFHFQAGHHTSIFLFTLGYNVFRFIDARPLLLH